MKYTILFLLAILTSNGVAQSTDSIAIKQVDSLILVSRELTAKSEFDQALIVNATAEQLALDKLGRESAAYGSCAFNRGRINQIGGDRSEAEKWYLQSIAIREKVLGMEHPNLASSLNNLAILYQDMGEFEKAEPLFIKTKDIYGKVLGQEHFDYVASLTNLAGLYVYMGSFEKAEPLFIKTKDVWGKVLGKEHPDYVASLINLAILYKHMSLYEKAEIFYLEAKDIRKKVLGATHPRYAESLNSLAGYYAEIGLYEKAEPLYLEAKSIHEKVLGATHPDYAHTLNNLAILYKNMGNYKKAELLYLVAKDIREKKPGKTHPDYAASLNNLAVLYSEMGNYHKAELSFLDANAIMGNVLGLKHPFYAASLNNLAILYKNMGDYNKAESLNLEAKAIREEVLGVAHPDYANSLNNLAILYQDMGQVEKAESLHLEARDIRQSVLGAIHPDYASSLYNLAGIYRELGQFEKSEQAFIEAKDIRKKVLGVTHPDYAASLNNLADLYERQTRSLEAESLMAEASTYTQARLVNATSFLSEQELSKYILSFQNNGDKLNAYQLAREANKVPYGKLPNFAYDQVLFYKGFLLTAATRMTSPKMVSPESMEINLRLKGYRRHLAAEYAKPIAERKSIAKLEESADLAEKELARSVSGYAEAISQIKWQEVQAALHESSVALEFVHFKVNFPQKMDSIMYAALLLRPGTAQPIFIPLFEEKELDHLLDGDRERKADYVNELYAWADRGMVKLGSEKKSLYDLIWAKIEVAGLEGIKTVYYSPSGVLHRLNLGAIAVDDETILSDRYNLVALNSTRQLVIPSTLTVHANDALLIGGVNFEVDTIHNLVKVEPLLASRSEADAWTESGTRGGSWSYLKWTEKEVINIAITLAEGGFKTTQLTDTEATEEAIKAIDSETASPRIVHIATHGFFFPDPEVKNEGLGLDGDEPVFKSSDNPMIRSGLILAGGNYAWQYGRAVSPDREDGILTAYEISQMNLSNTELVVLSACETGLGDIKGNEGVYGLQRAFKIAGAKYLIMSLWQVPDRETMEFMTTFYKNWLEEKLTIPEAFRKTQREMRDRFFNPYSWAGFVLVE